MASGLALALIAHAATAENIGEVSAVFKLLIGPNHKVVFDDLLEGSPKNSVTAVPVPLNQPYRCRPMPC